MMVSKRKLAPLEVPYKIHHIRSCHAKKFEDLNRHHGGEQLGSTIDLSSPNDESARILPRKVGGLTSEVSGIIMPLD
ncbi:hypothetical protein BST61_g6225 [Cercospora zeina]